MARLFHTSMCEEDITLNYDDAVTTVNNKSPHEFWRCDSTSLSLVLECDVFYMNEKLNPPPTLASLLFIAV